MELYSLPPQESKQFSRSEGWADQKQLLRYKARAQAKSRGVYRREPQAVMTSTSHDQTQEAENAGS